MLSIRKFIFLLLFVLHAICGWNQQSEQYVFTHYKLTDGLASNTVNNCTQDSDGFIWLSTNNGLQRFDGNTFTVYKTAVGNPATIPSDEVTQVYFDRKGRLWVLTADNKAGIFNTRSFRYKEIPVKAWNREKVYHDKTFIETADGKLLLHVRKSDRLFEFSANEQSFIPSVAIPFPQNITVNHIVPDRERNRYYLTTDSGLVMYNPATRLLSNGSANKENDPVLATFGAEKFLNYLYIDAAKRIYLEQWTQGSTHPVLKLYNPASNAVKEFNLKKDFGLGYHQVKSVLEQRSGRLWIFGLPFLAEYNRNLSTLQFLKKDYNREKDLKFNQVFSMFEDRQRNVWVCTDYGVYIFNPDTQLFHNYTLTTPARYSVEGRAQCAVQLPNNEVWVGFRDLGIYRYDKDFHAMPLPSSIVPLQEAKSVWDLQLHTKTSTLWIGLQGGKLIIYDLLTRQAKLLAPPAFEQRAVTQITEDGNGNLWFGTQGGNLVRWNHSAIPGYGNDAFTLIKKTGIIEKLMTDKNGFIWVCAVGDGLLKIDPKTNLTVHQIWNNNQPGATLWNNNPKDIIQYNDSLLLVASGALNIINLNTLQVKHISNRDGLPTNTVQSIAKDAAGRVWLGTMNGLCMADISKSSFTVYNESDGLLNDHFNAAGGHTFNDGSMLFTAAESFVTFNPSFFTTKESPGKAILTDVKLMNTSLSLDSLAQLKKVSLAYNKNYLVIEFSALNFSKLDKLDYYYQLEGFDTSWVKSNDRHQAIYTFLSPGSYTFKVKTKNVNGIFGPEATQLSIWVAPPFWQAWWFYAILVVCAGVVLYLVDRERIKRLAGLYSVRSDIAGQLHEDVSTTLNNINVLSQIAKRKADKDIVRSKELIDEISGKSHSMMVSMDEILWSIDPSNDTMEKTLLRISELAKTLETKAGVPIDIVVHEKVKDQRLEMKIRHHFFVTCKTALQHLSSTTSGESIMIDIDLIRSKILLKILFVGAETTDTHNNMLLLKKNLETKAAAMHAALTFEIGKRDTSIVLSIPVK